MMLDAAAGSVVKVLAGIVVAAAASWLAVGAGVPGALLGGDTVPDEAGTVGSFAAALFELA
jgi:hypothetical protein